MQEVGRAGRDGKPAWCHAFFNEQDIIRSQSLVHSDGVDRLAIKKLLGKIFGEKQPHATPSCIAIQQESLHADLDMKPEVAGTVLSRLELHPERLLNIITCVHNKAVIGFHRRTALQLADTVPVIRCLLAQNANSKKSRDGTFTLDLAQACTMMGAHIADIQRDLIRLKQLNDISIRWSDMSYIISLLRQPDDFDALVDQLTDTLRGLEEAQLRKVNIVAASMRLVATDSWVDTHPTSSSSSSSKANDAKAAAIVTNGSTQLTDIISQYFSNHDDTILLDDLNDRVATRKHDDKAVASTGPRKPNVDM